MSETKLMPHITVVIPALNEAKSIGEALQCIVDNGYQRDEMEVVLVDGGSRDATVQIAKAFSDRLQLRVIDAPGSSVYRALNIGLQAARGEFFVRVDARSLVPQNYISCCLRNLDHQGAQCVGGIQLQYGESAVGDSIARVTSSVIGTGGAKFRTSTVSGFVDSVYLGVYRTATLQELGGFEDDSDYVSEDALINKRIRERGGKIYLDAKLQVRYPAKTTFRALVKQYVIYGAAKAFVFRKYRIFTSFRQALPLLFLLGWIALAILSAAGFLAWTIFSAAVFVYLLVVAAANFHGGGRRGQRPGTLWGRTFATISIHFAWPIGFFVFLMSPPLHKRLVQWL
jgi:succinoglycan biosynthesis protein ExoA